MSEQFVSEYVASCIQEGKCSPAEICSAAQEEIATLEREIKTIEALRIKQNNLRNVIRQLGAAEPKPKRGPGVFNSSMNFDDLDNYTKSLCCKICEFVATHDNVTPRHIMDNVGTMQENKAIYAAYKFLLEQGILEVDDNVKRLVTPGENWENRPVSSAS